MPDQILVLYGSYRSDRLGIRLANFVVSTLRSRGTDAELIDAKTVSLPMLDRMYKEFAPGTPPPAMEALATKIKAADAFVFVTGEYNWGMQPGLKNLTDHFLEEWFWRPAAIVSYSAGRLAGGKGKYRLARHTVGDGYGRRFQHARRGRDRGCLGRQLSADRCTR
jgi:NAD(P)H-dependent FMN reductase